MRKLLSTAIALGLFTSMTLTPVYADVASNAMPILSTNGATNATIGYQGTNNSTMNIQVSGGQGSLATLNWDSYNVGSGSTVNYEFTANNQTAFNKVAANGGLSQIYGKITSTGCSNCTYDATGKIILMNPNGILFGEGSQVNVNSFTATTMDGTYDQATKKLTLKDAHKSNYGIEVRDGAILRGDKTVTLASDNIKLYKGSQISTNTGLNVTSSNGTQTAYGNVQLITADGVNFEYYNNGAVKDTTDVKASTDTMYIALNGSIDSGHIDVRNYSTDVNSQINAYGGRLKATKAVRGNDGNIWLTTLSSIAVGGTDIDTVNAAGAESREGGNLEILAPNGKILVRNIPASETQPTTLASTIDTVGNVVMTAEKNDIIVDHTTINAAKDVTLKAKNVASIQHSGGINAENIYVEGFVTAQAYNSVLKANNDITITAYNGDTVGDAYANYSDLNANKITVIGDNNVNVVGSNLNDCKLVVEAGKDVNIDASGLGKSENGLVAKAGGNMTVKTDGPLSISSLISTGDMLLDVPSIISGNDKTPEVLEKAGDSADRAYIEVGGQFTSSPSFQITKQADVTGNVAKRNHITYGENEKILLVNPQQVIGQPSGGDDPVTPTPTPVTPSSRLSVDNEHATMLNKLPRTPETYSNVTRISDTRTTFVDVFAAASQIEIVEDEE